MKLNSVFLYHITGLAGLPDNSVDYPLWQSGDRSAVLTRNVDQNAETVDRADAIAEAIFTGLFREDVEPLAERISSSILKSRQDRAEKFPGGLFLVFKAIEPVPSVNLGKSRDCGDFIVAFDAVEKGAAYARFRSDLQNCMAAVSLIMDVQADHTIKLIGRGSYLSDDTEKPIFPFSVQANSPRLSIARIMTQEQVEEASSLVDMLSGEPAMSKVVDLYLQSLAQPDDEFRGFLAGWTALEIFVHSLFKRVYGPAWFEAMKASAPASAASYIDRVNTVMNDKHRLLDKFVVIASMLDPDGAETDIGEVSELKGIRDSIIHGAADSGRYPAIQAQTLLRKYLRLHLENR